MTTLPLMRGWLLVGVDGTVPDNEGTVQFVEKTKVETSRCYREVGGGNKADRLLTMTGFEETEEAFA